MKIFLTLFLVFFSNHAFSSEKCWNGDLESLTNTWKLFYDASTKGNPEDIATFYKFPLKLYSPTDAHGVDEKPIIISKSIFMKNYRKIFHEIVQGRDVDIYKELKEITRDTNMVHREFDKNGCSFQSVAGIQSYTFVWVKNRGWLVESISYIDYGDLKDDFRVKK
ncbi:hypothetical protein AAKU55_005775 [Oxalobacteraceae bacterium GrIS 1.11]